MKSSRIYNLKFLVKIEINDKRLLESYQWRPEKTQFFGLFHSPKGYYHKILENFISQEDANKKYITSFSQLYEKPCIILRFTSDCFLKEEFNTFEEASKRADEIMGIANKIKFVANAKWLTKSY